MSDTGEAAPASASESGRRRDGGRGGSPTPIELREVSLPGAQAAADAQETEVRLCAAGVSSPLTLAGARLAGCLLTCCFPLWFTR